MHHPEKRTPQEVAISEATVDYLDFVFVSCLEEFSNAHKGNNHN